MSSKQSSLPARLALVASAAALSAVMLAGCGEKKDRAAASQTAAKVNKEEVTVHQINLALQGQRGLKPEQTEAAGRQVLERLIDQEVVLQKAVELKIDRDPRVVQQLEAMRREAIARAYAERVADAVPKPTAQEIRDYYEARPALFKERKIYNLQELVIEVKPEQIEVLGSKLQASRNIAEFVEYLKAQGLRFGANQAVRPAEQLPLASIDQLARMKDGEAFLQPSSGGATVVVVAASRPERVSLEQATPVIEQYLLNDRRRKAIEDETKALRAAARVEYVGKFAQGAAKPAERRAAPAASDSGLSSTDISKGMGFK